MPRNIRYGQYPGTHPTGPGLHYSESEVFNRDARGGGFVIGPDRKTAQFSITGGPTPLRALPANPMRVYLIVQNLSAATNLYLGFGSGATAANGILILPNGGNFLADYMPPQDEIYIFFAGGAAETAVIAETVAQTPLR